MIPYILHVTVITTVCFLFYKLLLQKETFYRLNRWTLMGCLGISFLLPLLPVPRDWSWRDRGRANPAERVALPATAKAEPAAPLGDLSPGVSPVAARQPMKRQAATV